MFPADIIASTDEVHWIPIIIGVTSHLLLLSIYMKGLSYFPNENIINIYLRKGKGITALFLVPVFLYLFMVLIISVRAYSEIISIVFLSNTPLWAIMVLILSISAFIASKGIEVILRAGMILSLLFLPIVILIITMSFQNVDWYYIYPLFNRDFTFLTQPSYLKSFFAFAGGFLFLGFVQPYFSYERKKILLAAIALIPFFLFSVYLPILTFGQMTASKFTFPFVAVVDAIYIHWLMLDRIIMFFC